MEYVGKSWKCVWGYGVKRQSFFCTVLDGNEWKASPTSRLNPIRMPDIRYLGGWLDHFIGLESDDSPLLAILTHSSSPNLVIWLTEHQIHKYINKQRLHYIKNQQDATLALSFISNCKITTCFGRFPRPSSGVLKTVVTATVACHGSGWCISSKDVQGR